MEIFKRAICLVCKKRKYIKFMIKTPIANANNDYSYCCNYGKCLRVLKISIEKEKKYHTGKIIILDRIYNSIIEDEKGNTKQLKIE